MKTMISTLSGMIVFGTLFYLVISRNNPKPKIKIIKQVIKTALVWGILYNIFNYFITEIWF